MYKVFTTLVKDGKNLGTGILCEDFDTLEKAKAAGEERMLFPGCFYKIREYDTSDKSCAIIVGGDLDSGVEVYSSEKEEVKPLKEVKTLKLLEFCVDPELSKYTDSMLFDSHETEIAFSKWSYGEKELRIVLLASEDDVYTGLYIQYEYVLHTDSCIDRNVEERNVSKLNGENILNRMEYIAKQYVNMSDATSEYPEYKLEGYDKDNDVYELFGMFSNKDDAVLCARLCNTVLKEGKIKRFCSDGTFKPIDWLEVKGPNYFIWKSYIEDYYNEHPVSKHDYTSSKVQAPDYSGMSYNEMQRAMMSDNID